LLLLADDRVDAATVRLALPAEQPAGHSGGALAERMETHEREVILAELQKHNFKMTDTARALGLERSHLYKKCQQLGIEHRSAG